MSYPKRKCNLEVCPYCQSDIDYGDKKVCNFPLDLEDAINDRSIPEECPWIKETKEV